MNQYKLANYLMDHIQANEEDINQLLMECSVKDFTKGTILLREGEKQQQTYFVEKGLLRQYAVDNRGKEHILQFAPEGWFMSDRESEFFDKPSSYFIESIEDTTAVLMDKSFIENLALSNSTFLRFNNHLLHNHIYHLQRRIMQLLSFTAEARYLDFVKIYPGILSRVPQAMVASYLGITPESLSRVRKELSERK